MIAPVPGAEEIVRRATLVAATPNALRWCTLTCVCDRCLATDRDAEVSMRPRPVLFTDLERVLASPIN